MTASGKFWSLLQNNSVTNKQQGLDGSKSTIFLDMILCSPVTVHRHFRGTYLMLYSCWCFIGILFDPEDGGSTYHRKVGEYLPTKFVLYWRVESSKPSDNLNMWSVMRQEGVGVAWGWTAGVRFPAGARFLSPAWLLGPTQPIKWVPGALSSGVKCPGHEADHSPPTTVDVKNICIYTFTPPYVFIA
jgi:hypothetical protein